MDHPWIRVLANQLCTISLWDGVYVVVVVAVAAAAVADMEVPEPALKMFALYLVVVVVKVMQTQPMIVELIDFAAVVKTTEIV